MRMRSTGDLGGAVAQARRDAGLTQAVLAELAGVSRRWLIELEGGKRPGAELSLVMRVAEALGMQLELQPVPQASPEAKQLGERMRAAMNYSGA
jgi:transcriptional regulator with XRE-family HTH domain